MSYFVLTLRTKVTSPKTNSYRVLYKIWDLNLSFKDNTVALTTIGRGCVVHGRSKLHGTLQPEAVLREVMPKVSDELTQFLKTSCQLLLYVSV